MPNGYYRELVENADTESVDSERIRVFYTIDRLLATEFNALDTTAIVKVIQSAHRALMNVAPEHRRDDSVMSPIYLQLDQCEREYEKIRPLFNRLVEMGFDPYFLSR